MFTPIIHNTNNALVKEYNRLIQCKPKAGSLQEKIISQRMWADNCRELLAAINGGL